MDGQSARRTLLARTAASAGAILLGARGGGMAAASDGTPIGGAQGTPVAGTSQEDIGMALRTNEELHALWGRWLELWNGNLAVGDEIIAPGFVAHFAPAPGSPSEVRGPEGLTGWIGGAVAAFADHRFETTVGPLVDGDMVAGRWVFRATYQGGIPGSPESAVGQPVAYEGADFLRVEDGQIAEYWLSADILQLLQQVGVIPS